MSNKFTPMTRCYNFISLPGSTDGFAVVAGKDDPLQVAEELAELIVKAVNNHDALVAENARLREQNGVLLAVLNDVKYIVRQEGTLTQWQEFSAALTAAEKTKS